MPSKPRYYCDVCDLYLSRDSEGGRRQHNYGYKHRENYVAFYKKVLEEKLQQEYAVASSLGFPEAHMRARPQLMRAFPPPE